MLEITEQVLGQNALRHPAPGAPDWTRPLDNPYLHGVYAPLACESEAEVLQVVGDLPRDLNGTYLRNGPNPALPPANRYHWFDGDGMVHAVRFEDGAASYRSRWIHTAGFDREADAGQAMWPGMMGPFDFSLPGGPIKDTANTDLLAVGRKVMALWYNAGTPYWIDPESLETLGPETFDGQVTHSISAHAKYDEQTGEVLFFTYGDKPPYMTLGVVSPEGRLLRRLSVDLPGPRLPHDMGFTPNYAVMHDLPFFHDPEILRQHKKRVIRFHRNLPARFGLVRRDGIGETRWFEAEPCYIYHVVNCWEEGDEVVMDACRCDDPLPRPNPDEGELASMLAYLRLQATLHRWRFNLKTGESREERLDDLSAEFPIINNAVGGQRSRYCYSQIIPEAPTLTFTGLVKYDTANGRSWRYEYGEGVFGSEAAFAARDGASSEDDGYVMAYVTDSSDWTSSCLVFDAQQIQAGPLCRVKLPVRVPAGFHATVVRP
ncbi:MAG: carotenoid oxygenase family protein [Alphaproteobacteria bacterium]